MANFNQLMQHAAQPNNWLIEDLLLHSDQLMIAAAPKAGKSLMAIQLAIAVASGGDFLRWKVTNPAKVLYLNLEIGEAPFAKRVQMQAAQLSLQEMTVLNNNLEVISDLRTIDIEAPADYNKVQQLVVLHKPQLVIFDVLARCHSKNENDNSTMKFVLQQLRKVVGTAATVVVHHSRKAPQGMEDANLGPSSMRGASAVHGEVDLAITLTKRSAKDGKFSVRFSARNINEPDEMFMDRDPATLLLAEVAPPIAKLAEVMQGGFQMSRRAKVKDIQAHVAKEFGVGERQARRILEGAIRDGLISPQREGTEHFYDVKNTSLIQCFDPTPKAA